MPQLGHDIKTIIIHSYSYMPKKEESILKNFGEHVKHIRSNKNLSLRAVAAKCELQFSKVGRIERGEVNVTLLTMIELAEGLDVPLNKLVNFDY